MDIIRTVDAMQQWSIRNKHAGNRVALVPTMGYLHAGHLRLVQQGTREADLTVVSLFVNPTQFGPGEDFERYPRDEPRDLALLEPEGVAAVFAPAVSELYPSGFQTVVRLEHLPNHLCGRTRPTHFQGVTTVVAKLFGAVQPDVALFGEKDFQQLQVIRQMTADLNMPVRIVGVPTVREPDGLAMSSRNVYLQPDERRNATALHQSLCWARAQVASGRVDAASLRQDMIRQIEAAGATIDYVEIVQPDTLEPLATVTGPARALIAARFGRTRLIDNAQLLPAPR